VIANAQQAKNKMEREVANQVQEENQKSRNPSFAQETRNANSVLAQLHMLETAILLLQLVWDDDKSIRRPMPCYIGPGCILYH